MLLLAQQVLSLFGDPMGETSRMLPLNVAQIVPAGQVRIIIYQSDFNIRRQITLARLIKRLALALKAFLHAASSHGCALFAYIVIEVVGMSW